MTHKLDEDELAGRRAANSDIGLSAISGMTYAQLDTYIDNNVTNLAEAKQYLKKLSKVVLAIVKWLD